VQRRTQQGDLGTGIGGGQGLGGRQRADQVAESTTAEERDSFHLVEAGLQSTTVGTVITARTLPGAGWR
jgi:hypothetical protein